MTLSAQLESLRRQRAQETSGSSHSPLPAKPPDTNQEISFLRRKLAQFRSGKWRRSRDNSMVRSQSWNHGLQAPGPGKLQSEWSSSLTSLREGEAMVDTKSASNRGSSSTEVPVKDKSPLTRSQSVCYKQSPPDVIKFRSGSQVF